MRKVWLIALMLSGLIGLTVLSAIASIGHKPPTVEETQAMRTTPSEATTSNNQNQDLSHQLDCASQMVQFQNRVMNQQKETDPNAKVYDFLIAYSPSLNTCVGGYTKYLNYDSTGTNANLYDFEIEDVLTGVKIDHFSGYGDASQTSWGQYKKQLSVLTDGAISQN